MARERRRGVERDAAPSYAPHGVSHRDLMLRSQMCDSTIEVTLSGDLDMAAAFNVESKLERLLETPDASRLVLDLEGVEFLDSAGLGAMLSVREHAKRHGIDFEITRMSGAVRRVLDATATRSALGG
jgi:anti-sigma B factor antagonist